MRYTHNSPGTGTRVPRTMLASRKAVPTGLAEYVSDDLPSPAGMFHPRDEVTANMNAITTVFPDGNCFFHCIKQLYDQCEMRSDVLRERMDWVARQYMGTDFISNAGFLRQLFMEYLRGNAALYTTAPRLRADMVDYVKKPLPRDQRYIVDNYSDEQLTDAYIRLMGRPTTYAGDVEFDIASQLFGVKIQQWGYPPDGMLLPNQQARWRINARFTPNHGVFEPEPNIPYPWQLVHNGYSSDRYYAHYDYLFPEWTRDAPSPNNGGGGGGGGGDGCVTGLESEAPIRLTGPVVVALSCCPDACGETARAHVPHVQARHALAVAMSAAPLHMGLALVENDGFHAHAHEVTGANLKAPATPATPADTAEGLAPGSGHPAPTATSAAVRTSAYVTAVSSDIKKKMMAHQALWTATRSGPM